MQLRSTATSFLAAMMVLATGCNQSNRAEPADFARRLSEAGLYAPPEYPVGCVSWQGTRERDSVVMRALVLSEPRCASVRVQDEWIVAEDGSAFFMGRTPADRRLPLAKVAFLADQWKRRSAGTATVVASPGSGAVTSQTSSPVPLPAPPANQPPILVQPVPPSNQAPVQGRLAMVGPDNIRLAGCAQRSKDRVLIVVRQHLGAFRYTYIQALQRNPSLAGSILFRFTINPYGSVTNALVEKGSIGDASADNGLLEKVRGMHMDQVQPTCGDQLAWLQLDFSGQ